MDGDSEKLKQTKSKLRGDAAERVEGTAVVQGKIYKMSADRGLRYTGFTSKLSVEKEDIAKNSAVITANEYATRTIVSTGSKSPTLTQEERHHQFSFTLVDGQWVLDKDEDLDKLIPVEHEPGIEPGKVTKLPDPLTSLDTKDAGKETKNRNKFQNDKKDPLSFLIRPALAASGTYNPTSAINYVRSYWGNSWGTYSHQYYNSAYRAYDNDCTNFMSQALNWSGWQHILGWYDDYHYWWYSNNALSQYGGRAESRSWINAQKLNYFTRSTGRGFAASSWSQFLPGDVIQIDFVPVTGEIEHSMMLTKIENGNFFVTQHSANYVDRNFIEVINGNPGAAYYGLLFYYQY